MPCKKVKGGWGFGGGVHKAYLAKKHGKSKKG